MTGGGSFGEGTATREGAGDEPPDPSESPESPDPPVEIVSGTATIDDLDAFLASIRTIGEETGAVVQAFDADLVVSADALRLATRLAARAIARDEAVARDPAVEILLYAAGRRQIDRALRLGVSEGHARVVAVVADFGAVSGAERPEADLPAAVERVEALVSDGDDGGDSDRGGDSGISDRGGNSGISDRGCDSGISDRDGDAERDGEATAEEWPADEDAIREFHGITDRELEATDGDLRDVVHERIALLDVEK